MEPWVLSYPYWAARPFDLGESHWRASQCGQLSPHLDHFCLLGNDEPLIGWLPLTDAILDRIESVFATAPATSYLRAADAIHLATAAEHGFSEILSNDRHLLAAA